MSKKIKTPPYRGRVVKRDTHCRSFVGGGGGGGDGEVSGAKLNGDTAVLISIGKSTDGVSVAVF